MTAQLDPAATLEALAAERDIERLIYRYSYALDEGDAAGFLDLFDDEGHVEIQSVFANRFDAGYPVPWEASGLALGGARTDRGVLFKGREVLSRFSALPEGVVRMQHVVSQPLITFTSPDQAAAESYMRLFAQRPDQPPELQVVGRYHDRFLKTAAGWRFAVRVIEI